MKFEELKKTARNNLREQGKDPEEKSTIKMENLRKEILRLIANKGDSFEEVVEDLVEEVYGKQEA